MGHIDSPAVIFTGNITLPLMF
uniref:Uncharacterized protein n=1 Tax=Anguilla anguilla TaxID=7936 RepID=A0A0E9VF05_ANGAN